MQAEVAEGATAFAVVAIAATLVDGALAPSLASAFRTLTFTRLTLILASVAVASSNADMRNVALCAAVGTLSGFHAAGLLDRSAYARMRARKGWSVAYFYVGHVALHVAPIAGLMPGSERPVTAWHGCAAALLHMTWSLITDLDATYVPMSRAAWRASMSCAFAAELCVPLLTVAS